MGLNTTPATWVSGAVVTAAQMNTELRDGFTGIQAAWTSYTPALTSNGTNPTLGTGNSATGGYLRIGKTIIGNLDILFGTPGFVAGTGSYEVSLPVAMISGSVTVGSILGSGIFFDNSGVAFTSVELRAQSTTTVRMVYTGGTLSATTPVIPANSDRIHVKFTYQAA